MRSCSCACSLVGQYHDDLPHGRGVYVFASGQRYEGDWLQGMKHGWSIYSVEEGSTWAAHWYQGKPTWVQPLGVLKSRVTVTKATMDVTAVRVMLDRLSSGSTGGSVEEMRLQIAAVINALSADDQWALAVDAQESSSQQAAESEQKATQHWDPQGLIQAALQAALQRAESAATAAQHSRRKAVELGHKLDQALLLAKQARKEQAAREVK